MAIWHKSYPRGIEPIIDVENYQSIVDVINKKVKQFKDQKAFTCMGQSVTFTELDRLSDYFASYLLNHCGLEKGDRIAIQLPNLLQYPIVLFGALKAGLIVVNTNPLYTDREMEHQYKDAEVKVVVILANFAHNLQKIMAHTDIKHVIVTEIGDMLPTVKKLMVNFVVKYLKKMVPSYHLPTAVNFLSTLEIGKEHSITHAHLTRQDIAFLQYTGGTTGVSKGAILTHGNIIANMNQIFAWMSPKLVQGKEICITPLPLYHIFSLTVNCLALMCYGAENILITNPRDLSGFIKELKKYKFTVMSGVNTLYNGLLNHPDFKTVDFSHLKVCVAGAMALQEQVARRWKQATGTAVIEGYGLTESSPVVTCNPVDGTDQPLTIGLPVPNTEIKLVDDNNQVVPEGEPGELCCRGPQVMQGYWNRPDETAKVMIDGWLHTGDIATMAKDGYFKIVDRKKDMILVSGFNVYPNEVEDVIASHPAVLEVAAVGVPDPNSGESVKVFIVVKEPVTETEIRNFAKTKLTGYKVPKFVEFRNDLPKSNVGKILRRKLKQPEA